MKPFRLLTTKKITAFPVEQTSGPAVDIIQKEFITIIPGQTTGLKEKVKQLCGEEQAVVFTSKNAVMAVAALTENDCAQWKIFCTEGQTKEHVSAFFAKADIRGTAADAEKLSGVIASHQHYKKLVFFCGNKRREELPSLLSARGITVEEVIVYETKLSPEKITEAFDGISFFSPSAAESFFSVNGLHKNIICFSIGATTTSALKKFTQNTILTSESSSEKAMFDLIYAYVKKNNE